MQVKVRGRGDASDRACFGQLGQLKPPCEAWEDSSEAGSALLRDAHHSRKGEGSVPCLPPSDWSFDCKHELGWHTHVDSVGKGMRGHG